MKKLYVRFFDQKDDQVPANTYFVCVDNCGDKERLESIELASYHISMWMRGNLERKTDFVWA